MASSTKIGSVVPGEWVGAVTDRLPDHLPDLSQVMDRLPPQVRDLPSHVDVGEVTDRVRDLTSNAASTVRASADRAGVTARNRPDGMWRILAPLLAVGVVAVLWAVFRSRRSTTEVGSVEREQALAHS